MNSKILLIGAGGALLYLVSRAKSITETVRFLEYTPGAVDLKFEGLVPVLNLRLDIYNPNRTSVPINGIIGQINFKGKPVASFVNTDKVNITANMKSSINLKVRLSLFNTAVALFTKEANKIIDIDGLIKTSITDIPFGYSYDFTRKIASKLNPAVTGVFSSRIRQLYKRQKKQSPLFINAFKVRKQLPELKQSA